MNLLLQLMMTELTKAGKSYLVLSFLRNISTNITTYGKLIPCLCSGEGQSFLEEVHFHYKSKIKQMMVICKRQK